jgi:CO/xanthine dehydrogenase FAD-binding subunit
MPLSLKSFSTVADANAALKAGGARYLGGGTLVVRAANEGDLTTDTFVRSTDPQLNEISVTGEAVQIGASVTMASIARHPGLAPLAKAARSVGGPAIRNMATVGGNLFAPAPYGDFAVMLVALDATAELEGRSIPIKQLPGDNVQGVVTAVRFKLPAASDVRFVKVSRTKPKGVSVLSIAVVIETSPDGTISNARIALGCMAEHPIRARAAEAALKGASLTADGIAKAVAAIGEGTNPITDPIASAWYRSEVLPVHFRRLLIG